MRNIKLGKSNLSVPVVAVGCMRLTTLSELEANKFINHCLELGANFFDHADIYGDGDCESIFAKAIDMKPSVREKMLIQSKCGIRKGMYDFSKSISSPRLTEYCTGLTPTILIYFCSIAPTR